MRDFAREYRWFLAALALVSVAVLVPVWSVELLPFLDWPQHLAIVSILRHFHDPAWGFERWFVLDPQITTYLTFYYGSAFVAHFTDVETACRIMLSVFLVTTPAALAYMLRCFHRSPWPALLSAVAVYGWPLYMGFASYLLSMPLLFLAIGLMQGLSEEISRSRVVALAGVAVLLFFTHALGYLFLGAITGPMILVLDLRQPKRMAATALAYVPSLALFAAWFVPHFLGSAEETLGSAQSQVHAASAEGGTFGAVFRPFEQQLGDIRPSFNEAFQDDTDAWTANAWFAMAGALLALGLALSAVRAIRGEQEPFGREWWHAWVAAALAVLLYLFTPMEIAGIWAITPRVVIFAACGALLLIPPLFRREDWNAVLFAPVVGLVFHTADNNLEHFRRFQDEASGLGETLEALPRGQRVYGLMYDSGSRVMSQAVYLHFPAYYMVRRGGVTGFTFVHNPSVPIRFRNNALIPYPGQRGEWEPWRWRYDLYGAFYDGLLARGPDGVSTRIQARSGEMERLASSHAWTAWANRGVPAGEAIFAFRENIHHATVSQVDVAGETPCFAWDGSRIVCPHADWTWVGPTQQDFGSTSIPCVWAHPFSHGELRVRWGDLPSGGNVLRGFYGIADSGFQDGISSQLPVAFEVLADGVSVGAFRTGPRRGYETFEIVLEEGNASPGEVVFRVSAENDSQRHFCFNATMFREPGAQAPPATEGAVQEGAVQEGAVQEGAVQEGAVQEGAVQEGAVQEGAVPEGFEGEALGPFPEPSGREDTGGGSGSGEGAGAATAPARPGRPVRLRPRLLPLPRHPGR